MSGSVSRRTLKLYLASLLLLSLILVLAIDVLGRVASAEPDGIAGHVVISEVRVADDEFVELYNPTDDNIDMTGWHWCYFSSTKTSWSDPHRDKAFPDGAMIAPHGFYLIQVYGTISPTPDWSIGYGTSQLGNTAGTVGIFHDAPSDGTKVDAVGWGSVTLKEGTSASAPGSGESIERKAQSTSTKETMGPDGVDEFRGNGYDSDNNSFDFVLRDTPEPQNSSSPQEPGPPASVTVTADPTTIPADGSSTSTITAAVKDQYSNSVADGTPITFTTSLGSFVENDSQTYNTTTTGGAAAATLRSSTNPGTATVMATSDSASGQATVEFTPLMPIGGVTVCASKFELLAPWIDLAALACIVLASGAAVVRRHRS